MLKDLSPTWKIVLAAGRLDHLLVPCDVPSFIAFYSRYRCCLPALVVAAFVKEPGALDKLEGDARRTNKNLQEADAFRECWLNVPRKNRGGDEQRHVELSQLIREAAAGMREGQPLDASEKQLLAVRSASRRPSFRFS